MVKLVYVLESAKKNVPAGIFYENNFIKCPLKNLIETIGILQPKNITFGRFG